MIVYMGARQDREGYWWTDPERVIEVRQFIGKTVEVAYWPYGDRSLEQRWRGELMTVAQGAGTGCDYVAVLFRPGWLPAPHGFLPLPLSTPPEKLEEELRRRREHATEYIPVAFPLAFIGSITPVE